MSAGPTTHSSLLVRLRDVRDEEAWSHFVRVYTPLVYRYARRRGLQDADTGDIAQDVLRAVVKDAGNLQRIHRGGSFRSWLFTLAHHKVYDLLRARERKALATGDSTMLVILHEQPAREDRAAWEREYREQLFAWAAGQVEAQCSPNAWQAFRQTTVEGKAPAAVAQQLGMTVAAVYLAKSRIMARIKEQVSLWEGDNGDD
jgi:RNA polymerase sigma factor (sigma-70 family)